MVSPAADGVADLIVVGSGASGAMAAETLARSGRAVTVIDGGARDDHYQALIPRGDFSTIRRSDPAQHRYFLGDDFEGVGWMGSRVGTQLTPPRGFLVRGVDEWLPRRGGAFHPVESLAYGGLGGGWGVGCYVLSAAELDAMGLGPGIGAAYQEVSDRIGISGEPGDDAAPYCVNGLAGVQPAPPLEPGLAQVLAAYERRREWFREAGFFVGRSALALLTRRRDGREPTSGEDMDFWSDHGKSAYRSWITLDRLRQAGRVRYEGGMLVTRFRERDSHVEVEALDLNTGEAVLFAARRLVLAAGALGTARIVLRSIGSSGRWLPVLCNPYTYVPCIQPRLIGRPAPERATSFSGLTVYHDPSGSGMDVAMAALFSYRSLLLYKLAREVPLSFADTRRLLQGLLTSFTIAGVHHPDRGDPARRLRLVPMNTSRTGDALDVSYSLRSDEEQANGARERTIMRALLRLGCVPLKAIRTPPGASIHYGGTLPFASHEAPDTLAPDGRLRGARRVFVADGSGFAYLPARGPTLTLMANGHRVAASALKSMTA